MPPFYPAPQGASSLDVRMELLRRKPMRATCTLNWQLHQRLQERADQEGRSLSNLMAHLLETATS